MTAPTPTPDEAAGLVDTAGRLQSAVRAADGWRYVAWLTGMAVATLMYGAGLGVAGADDGSVGVVSVAFVLCVAALSLTLLPGARVTSSGFPSRWFRALGAWGVLFAAMMVLGLLMFRGDVTFWLPAAAVAALPLALGARTEGRA